MVQPRRIGGLQFSTVKARLLTPFGPLVLLCGVQLTLLGLGEVSKPEFEVA